MSTQPRNNTDIDAEIAGIVTRHQTEIRRLETATRDLRGRVPASLLAAMEHAATGSLALIVEIQRVRGGILGIDDVEGATL